MMQLLILLSVASLISEMLIGTDKDWLKVYRHVHLSRAIKQKNNIYSFSRISAFYRWYVSRTKLNKSQKIKNGNLKNKTKKISFLHWNKASSHFKTNKDLILLLIDKYSPDLFIIPEAQISFNLEEIGTEFNQYNVELKIMDPINKRSRIAMFISKNITYKRTPQFESPLNSFIWIELLIPGKRPVNIGGGYRQHSLPHEMGIKNSNENCLQIQRFESILENWQNVLKLNNNTIVSMDTNVDTNPASKSHNYYLGKKLFDRFMDFIENNKLFIHNTEFTRYAPHQDPTIIDHIVSNCQNRLTNVVTKPFFVSDHCYLHTTINIDVPISLPKFKTKRDQKLLHREAIVTALEVNPYIYEALNYQNPNYISDVIINGLNFIIEALAR